MAAPGAAELEPALRGLLSSSGAERTQCEALLLSGDARELALALARFALGGAGAGPAVLRRLAAVLLRRVVRPRDAGAVLGVLLDGGALVEADAGLSSALVHAVALLVLRCGSSAALLAAFRRSVEERASVLRAVSSSVKCAKVLALGAAHGRGLDVDDADDGARPPCQQQECFSLALELAPAIEAALSWADCAGSRAVARAAVAVRKVSETALQLGSPIAPRWLELTIACAGRAGDVSAERCELLRALRALLRLEPEGARRRKASSACMSLCASSLKASLSCSGGGASLSTCDSDDGEPQGRDALSAVALDFVSELWPLVGAPRGLVPELVSVSLRCAVLSGALSELFFEDANEFVSLHEDESVALLVPRHAAAGVLQALAEDWPLDVVAALCSAFPSCGSALEKESALWLLGNLWFSLEPGSEARLRLGQGVQPFLERAISECGASGGSPLLLARLLWALWACWSPALCVDAERCAALVLSALSAPWLGVGLHGCRGVARLAPLLGWSPLRPLVAVLQRSSGDTAHIAVEALRLVLDQQLRQQHQHVQLEDKHELPTLLGALLELWAGGAARADPLLREGVAGIVAALLPGLGVATAVAQRSPSLLAAALDEVDEEAPRCCCCGEDELRSLRFALRDALLRHDGPHAERLDGLDCLRACARRGGAPDAAADLELALSVARRPAPPEDRLELLEMALRLACDVLRSARALRSEPAIDAVARLGLGRELALGIAHAQQAQASLSAAALAELALCVLMVGDARWLRLDHLAAAQLAAALCHDTVSPLQAALNAAAAAAIALLFPDVLRCPGVAPALQRARAQLMDENAHWQQGEQEEEDGAVELDFDTAKHEQDSQEDVWAFAQSASPDLAGFSGLAGLSAAGSDEQDQGPLSQVADELKSEFRDKAAQMLGLLHSLTRHDGAKAA
jgi:hypothetical protein